jgi:hypothetical protein
MSKRTFNEMMERNQKQTAEDRGIEGATMTGKEMRAIRKNAGLSIYELAALLRYRDFNGLRRMEECPLVTGPIQVIMEAIREGRIDPNKELE